MWRTMELLQKQNAALMRKVEELQDGREALQLKIEVTELKKQLQAERKQLKTSVDLLTCFQSMTPHIDSFLGKLSRVTGSSSLPSLPMAASGLSQAPGGARRLRPSGSEVEVKASASTQIAVVQEKPVPLADATTGPMQQPPPPSLSPLPSSTAEAEAAADVEVEAEAEAEAEAEVEADDSGSALLQLTPSNVEDGPHISSTSTPEKSGGSSSSGGKKRKKADTGGGQQTVEVVFLDPPHDLIARYANLEQASELSGVDLHLLTEVLATARRRGPPPDYSGLGWRYGEIADRIYEYSKLTLAELVARATAKEQASDEMDEDRVNSNARSGVAAAAAAVGVQPHSTKRLDMGDMLKARAAANNDNNINNNPLSPGDGQLGEGGNAGQKRLRKGPGPGRDFQGAARPVARHPPVFHGPAPGVGVGQKLSMMPLLYPNDGYPTTSVGNDDEGEEGEDGEEGEAAAPRAFAHPPPPPPPPQAKRPRPMSRDTPDDDDDDDEEEQGRSELRQSHSSFNNTRHRSGDVGPPRLPTPHHKKRGPGRPKTVHE